MSEDDRRLLVQAMHALSDALRLWPAKHPAAGMIVGIEDDCRRTYEQIKATRDDIFNSLAVQSN